MYVQARQTKHITTWNAFIELQTILLKSIILILQEHRYFDIIIKPHPDSISRIDQTIQQSIVQSLIDIECIEGIRIIWPEEKVGNVDLRKMLTYV